MRFLLCLFFLLSLFHQVIGGARLPVLPRYPSQDEDFYKPPEGNSWKEKPPGTILRARNVTFASLLYNLPSRAKAYQLLFVTRDVNEKPATTVTTVVVPVGANFNRLLSFQGAYDSPDIDCSPSYGFRNQVVGSAYVWNQAQLFILGRFPLTGGPVINIPDYEGSNAAFTVGPQTAYHTLDSIRAALNSQHITGLNPEANTILYGYSGGGLATEWATEFHSSYAPTLKVIGAAMGGLPTNITKTYQNVNNGTFSELNVLATLGLANAYPKVDAYVKEHLRSDYKKAFFYPRVRCGPQAGIDPQPALSKMNITAMYDNGDDILTDFRHILNKVGVMGKHIKEDNTPNFPLYIWAGTNDDVVRPIADVGALVNKYREMGTKVTYKKWLLQDHISALILGLGPAHSWIRNRFAIVEKLDQLDPILQGDNEDLEDLPMDGTEEEVLAEWFDFGSQGVLSDEMAAEEQRYEL